MPLILAEIEAKYSQLASTDFLNATFFTHVARTEPPSTSLSENAQRRVGKFMDFTAGLRQPSYPSKDDLDFAELGLRDLRTPANTDVLREPLKGRSIRDDLVAYIGSRTPAMFFQLHESFARMFKYLDRKVEEEHKPLKLRSANFRPGNCYFRSLSQ